jgi:hypothetical protein
MSSPGRIVCARCGANNFSTQAACWKCGAALSGAPPTAASASGVPGVAPLSAPVADPSTAVWAAIALAILFPLFAVPAGLIFLMFDDRRRAELGRITLIWGVLATIVHLGLTAVFVKAGIDEIRGFLPGGRIGAPALPNPNDSVPPPNFPQ